MSIGRRVREARSLLKWSKAALAEKTGLTPEMVDKVEKGTLLPPESILKDIVHVFDVNGVEIIDQPVVRLKTSSVDEFHGREGFRRFYDFVYADLMTNGGYVSISGFDERLFCEHYGEKAEENTHISRMNELIRLRDEPHCVEVLVCEGREDFIARGYAKYRWVNEEHFTPTCFYVFNSNLAFINFAVAEPPNVILIKSKPFADSYRELFQNLWSKAIVPPCPCAGDA